MSLLSDDEIDAVADKCFAQYMNDENDAYDLAFARAIEAAILAKLAAKELPEPEQMWLPTHIAEVYTAAQLHEAHAQGFAAGAAAQLAEKPSAWAMRDALDELLANSCSGITVGVETDWRKVPLYTRREA